MAKKTAALTVRFTDEQHERLRELAATSGLEPAQLVRIAVDGLADYSAAHGGKLHQPLDFTTFFTELKAAVQEPQHHPPPRLVAEDPAEYKTPKPAGNGGE